MMLLHQTSVVRHAGVVAAAAVSNPFDLGAAWKRQAATFPFGLHFLFQYLMVLRCGPEYAWSFHILSWTAVAGNISSDS